MTSLLYWSVRQRQGSRPRMPWWVAAAVLAGLAMRGWVLRSRLGVLDGDEAYTGLEAAAIWRGRAPVVISGNAYGAVVESYLLAPWYGVIGHHAGLLKLLAVAMWAAACVLLVGLSRRWTGRGGFPAAALLWLTPGAVLVISTRLYVGYGLGLALAVGALWSLAAGDEAGASRRVAAASGAASAAAVYCHPMYIALVLPSVVATSWARRRDLRSWWLPAGGAAVAVGAPWLIWNVSNGFPSLEQPSGFRGTYVDRLEVFATQLMPRAFGLRSTIDGTWVLGRPAGLLIYAVIVAASITGAVIVARRHELGARRWRLLVSMVAVFPIMALFQPLIFADDGRYAIISLPLVALAIATTVEWVGDHAPRGGLAAPAAAAAWVGLLSVPFLAEVAGRPVADPNRHAHLLAARLEADGYRYVAGSYWEVHQVEFFSDGAIRAAVVGTYPQRFPDRQREIGDAPPVDVAFVFAPFDEDPRLLFLPVEAYEREVVDGAIVYTPRA